jgi:hypothetical protein
MNNRLVNSFYNQPNYHVYLACSQCLRHACCIRLEEMGMTREEVREVYSYNG